jgi:hypothetical protein
MLTFWGVVAGVTVFGGIPTVGGLWVFERWRSRRRNRSGECATCGAPWGSTPSGDPYLIHGRLVCEDCAETARRRMPWQFGILGVAAAAAGMGGVMADGSPAMIILVPIGSTGAMTLGAVQLMKLANRRAQRRIAAGEFPDMKALAPVASQPNGTEEDSACPD